MSTFHKLHKESKDSTAQELDLFSVPLTKTSVLDGEILEVKPITAITDNQIEFEIDSANEHYLDLESTALHIQAKIVKKDGSTLDAGESPVITANNLLHSLFSNISVQINGKVIEEENNYPYRAYLEDLLNMNRESKKTHLRASGWIERENDSMPNTADITASLKTKLEAQASFLKESGTFELIGRLKTSLGHQARYLIPGLSVRIKLLRSSPSFVLQKLSVTDQNEYQIKISSAQLLCHVQKLNPAVQTAHMKLLTQGNKVKYPITRVETQFFTISPGRQSEQITILQNRQEPKRVFLGMVDHVAKNGAYTRNPFRFDHNNVQTVNFKIGGHLKPPTPFTTDFTGNCYLRAYHNLMTTCGKAFMSEDNAISPEEFANGKTVFCLDNTPDGCQGHDMHLFRNTTTRVELTFKEALTRTVSVFVYCEFDDILELDHSRIPTLTTAAAS